MRTSVMASLLVGGLLLAASSARAGDDAFAVLEKAIKAHGGAANLDKQHALRTKSKGTLEGLGGLAFTEEATIQQPDQLKSVVKIEVNGMNIDINTVFNKDKGWIKVKDQLMDMDEKLVNEMKETLFSMSMGRLTNLKDKKYEVSLVGDDKVEGKEVTCILVASKGHRDIRLFFDKKTGLLAKMAHQALDAQSGQEVSEERIIHEYMEIDGKQVPKKVTVNRDGKKFVEAEVLEVTSVDKVDDSEFAKP
jgi:hypothetical protein